jgi:hypothetical protein
MPCAKGRSTGCAPSRHVRPSNPGLVKIPANAMLLTDSDIITAADLAVLDPECLKVAASQQMPIVVEGPGSIIRHTIEECCTELLAKFQNFSGYLVSPGINLNHVAAVMNILSTAINRPRMRLNQVVATQPDPSKPAMQHWLEHAALRNLYRAAFARFSANEDRYQRKMEWWDAETKTAWLRLINQGIPIVLQPLPCPGAVREYNAGAFDGSCLAAAGTGSSDPGQTWELAITWVGAAYGSANNKNNNESAGSAAAQVVTSSGQVITVSIANLNPPAATLPPIGTADNIYNQVAATGWNVYAGNVGGPYFLQNATPIPLSTSSYTLANAPVLSGTTLQAGQFPDYNFAFQNVLMRG